MQSVSSFGDPFLLCNVFPFLKITILVFVPVMINWRTADLTVISCKWAEVPYVSYAASQEELCSGSSVPYKPIQNNKTLIMVLGYFWLNTLMFV